MKVKTSSPVPLSVKVPSPNDPQIQCGLDKNTSAKFEKTEANEFPAHLNAMVDGSVKSGGSPHCIAVNDLSSLLLPQIMTHDIRRTRTILLE